MALSHIPIISITIEHLNAITEADTAENCHLLNLSQFYFKLSKDSAK